MRGTIAPPGATCNHGTVTDTDFFLSLETQVWAALARGDVMADRALLSPEFLGVYATGFSGRDGHSGQLAGGATVAQFELSQARLLPLGPGRALLAYRADYTRTGADAPEAMFVSSIWEKTGGQWLNTFSQDTAESHIAPV